MKEVEHLDFHDIDDRSKLSQLVEKIDKDVSLSFLILSNLVNPIIIGGGHNNSYGNIKGTALQRKPVNAINFDAHSDFRILEGRHSGNGFSYAYEEAFLKNIFFWIT
jgi:formiminoglutamase